MKSIAVGHAVQQRASHPARGAWIEMRLATITTPRISRTPQGVRGLKLDYGGYAVDGGCRTPQGVRGLK